MINYIKMAWQWEIEIDRCICWPTMKKYTILNSNVYLYESEIFLFYFRCWKEAMKNVVANVDNMQIFTVVHCKQVLEVDKSCILSSLFSVSLLFFSFLFCLMPYLFPFLYINSIVYVQYRPEETWPSTIIIIIIIIISALSPTYSIHHCHHLWYIFILIYR